MPRIDLLPREYRQRRRARRTLQVVIIAGVVYVTFLALVFFLYRMNIGREEETLRREKAQAARLRAQVAQLQQFATLQQTVEARRGTLASALSGDIAWSKFLNDLSLIMPDNSWLTNAALSAAVGQAPTGEPSFGAITFSGFVFDFPGLAGWLTRIDQIDGLTFVYLTNGTKSKVAARDVVQFGSTASVTAPLLSQRCQAGKPCP